MRALLLMLALALTPAVAAGQAQLLIVSGLGGEPKYVEDFHRWGLAMVEAAQTRFGVPEENIVFLAEDPSRDPLRIDGESRKDAVLAAVREIESRAGEGDRVMVLLIGHGSTDSRGSRINLPGPDITAEELNTALSRLGDRPVVVVNTASASGDFQEILAADNRAIVTATRSGMESNETVFGGYFVAAFTDGVADVNKDGRVTVAEAYEYATRETERDYTNGGRLQSEHSRMEGNLEIAATFHLGAPVAAIPDGASPELEGLYTDRQRIQDEVEALRVRSGQMEPAAYQAELERLLLELARTNREIQQREGSS